METKQDLDNIWDAFSKMSDSLHNAAEFNTISQEVSRIENSCGSCNKWMTKQCEREKHHKVSCGEIKCNDFDISSLTQLTLNKKYERINSLKEIINKTQ